MFFAVFSNLTPPVALAALVASGIAGGSYFKTSFIGFKIAMIAFILPYLIIWNPAVIMQPETPFIGVMTILSILLAMLAIAIVFTNYFITAITLLQRILFSLSAVILLGYAFTVHNLFLVIGIVLMALLTYYQMRTIRKI